jgi:hypothetical protein
MGKGFWDTWEYMRDDLMFNVSQMVLEWLRFSRADCGEVGIPQSNVGR